MGLKDNFANVFTAAGKKARQAYDYTKLELRIKGYEKELREAYQEIGRIIYKCHKNGASPDNTRLGELFTGIDNIGFRIQQLNKTVAEIKKQNDSVLKPSKPVESTVVEQTDIPAFAKLARKEGDLKIRRTEGGIQVLRFCTACGFGNEPQASACAGCGYVFKKEDKE